MTIPPGTGPEPVGGPPVPITGHGAGAPDDEPPILETERITAAAARRPARFGAVTAAWTVALVADGLQWVIFPLVITPAGWPADGVIDVVTAGILIKLLGWHWAFLPTFLVELIPGVDMVPTWTVAVFLATRGRKKKT